MTKTIYPDMTNTFWALVGTTCIAKFKVIWVQKICMNASPSDYVYICTTDKRDDIFTIPVRAVKQLPRWKVITIVDEYDFL